MVNTAKETLVSACRALLRPIVLILLRGGVTYREFAALAKEVFVAVATDEFGIRGRPTNVSRVSILTGISRKEVKRQRERLAADPPVDASRSTDATRVLSGWHQDPDYVDEQGRPRSLPPAGERPSFSTLFEEYGGDTPVQTLLRELKTAGSIEEDADGRLVARRRYHMPAAMDEGSLRFFGTNLHDHAATLANNLAADGRRKRLEGFAVDARIDPAAADAFREFVDRRGQQFLEEVDDWLARHRLGSDDAASSPVRLGLGVYAIEGPLPEGTLT